MSSTVTTADPDVVTEVPEALKRLVRYITRGFYSTEHAIIVDMLVHHPCLKEDDLCEVIKFERKALRGLVNTLKTDKFLKSKVRIETTSEGKQTHHSYYFINYSSFVNVVKYKLDHIRKKIETEERESTSRASFKCPSCKKMYTDLEADQLFDFVAQKFLCTYCRNEVEEEASTLPRQDARTLMVKFNEQVEPLFALLREVEDIKLGANILEPEPMDLKLVKEHKAGGGGAKREGVWSGDTTRPRDYGLTEKVVTIDFEGQDKGKQVQQRLAKERPIWMVESTVEGASNDSNSVSKTPSKAGPSKDATAASSENDLIFRTLLAHETKTRNEKTPGIPGGGGGGGEGGSDEDSTSSESEDEFAKKPTGLVVPAAPTTVQDVREDVEEMEDEDDEEEAMVSVGSTKVPYHEVTEDMVARMTPVEKEQYIRTGQEMYKNMYE